ncbi:Ff.00g067520.m01.CDS01 [Fusarium sp. VM40]|nr:Ff.00g067520.m01.CDS01 [Fusarium sp. VM40]
MNLIGLAAESLMEYDLLPRPLRPLEERQALVCERSKHLSFSNTCDACEVPLDPWDNVVFVYTKEWPMGPWSICWSLYRVEGYNRRGSMTQIDGLCFCNGPRSSFLGCAVLHSRCFDLVLGPSPSREMINRLGTDLVWRKPSNLWFVKNCHPRINVPEPDGFHHLAVSTAARRAGIPLLGRLPPELVVSIQSLCPDKPFWELVRVYTLKFRLLTLPDGEQVEDYLSTLVSWKRGDATPLCSTFLSNTERLRITIDSDGIYKIERLSEHVHPPKLLKRRLKRYIIANVDQVKSIRAYFKDGLCWLLHPTFHPGFTIWDTSAPPQALELSSTANNGRYPKIVGFEECSMVPDSIPRTLSIETIDITARCITGISFRLSPSLQWKKFDVFVHDKSKKPTSCTKSGKFVFMPLPTDDEILWLQLRSSKHASSLMVKTKLSGVIHIGSQATEDFRVKAFSRRPQRMLCNNGLGEAGFHQPLAFYPKGDSNDPRALSMITGPQLRHIPPSSQLLWSWAPLEHIDNVSVYEEHNGNFQGMRIVYKNGGERFVGINQHLVPATESAYCKEPTHLSVETTAPMTTGGSLGDGPMYTMVSFAPADLWPLPSSEYTQYPLEGELHCWVRPLERAEIRVLPSGTWRSSDVLD